MTETSGQLPTKDDLSAVVNSIFTMKLPDGSSTELFLLSLDEIVSNSVQETFALQFRAPSATPAAQGTYRLAHEKLGTMDLFLVPVKRDDAGLYFEAVFNHFLEASQVKT